jgi:hypothetical protein
MQAATNSLESRKPAAFHDHISSSPAPREVRVNQVTLPTNETLPSSIHHQPTGTRRSVSCTEDQQTLINTRIRKLRIFLHTLGTSLERALLLFFFFLAVWRDSTHHNESQRAMLIK